MRKNIAVVTPALPRLVHMAAWPLGGVPLIIGRADFADVVSEIDWTFMNVYGWTCKATAMNALGVREHL